MKYMSYRLLFAFLLLLHLGLIAHAQKGSLPPASSTNEIMPPFSLVWHEPSERVEAKIMAAKLNVVEYRKIGARWALTVNGFKKPNANDPKAPKPPQLQRVLFYFVGGQLSKDKARDGKVRDRIAGGQLVEVELQYEEEGWNDERYGSCLSEKRQMLERLYGEGQQIVRNNTPAADGKATQTLVGYKWNKNNTAVELIYFNVSMTDGSQAFHTLSLHYKRS
jgi:hypothetical protein